MIQSGRSSSNLVSLTVERIEDEASKSLFLDLVAAYERGGKKEIGNLLKTIIASMAEARPGDDGGAVDDE